MVHNQFNVYVKSIHIDFGSEFIAFYSVVRSHSIIHHFTCSYAFEHNGVIESKYRKIVDVSCLTSSISLPLKF